MNVVYVWAMIHYMGGEINEKDLEETCYESQSYVCKMLAKIIAI